MKAFQIFVRKLIHQDKLMPWLMISVVTGISLLLIRILYTRQLTLSFFLWNLFLAYIPYLISASVKNYHKLQKPGLLSVTVVFTWLAFFPNAPYILTDFIHLHQRQHIPYWYDIIIFTLFAWNGLIIGFMSLHDMQQVVSGKFGPKYGWYFALTVLLLGSFGVYIGRHLRYNSWDVIMTPYSLAKDMVEIVIYPLRNKSAFKMTAGMSIFLITTYYTFKVLINARLTKSSQSDNPSMNNT